MSAVTPCEVPDGSLLDEFGPTHAYRDAFTRIEPGVVTLEELITRFYSSGAFRPERVLLGLAGHPGNDEDAAALARGETDRFAVWRVVERRETEILLQDKTGATASWLAVRPAGPNTQLLFGSWVGQPEKPLVKALMPFHRWYSRWLLRGA